MLWGILAAAALFTLPGLVLVRREEWQRCEPIELAGVAGAGSAALWSVLFWILRVVPISWAWTGLAVAAAAGAVVLARGDALDAAAAAAAAWRTNRLRLLWQSGFVLAVCALRLAFAGTHVAYSGGDMTAHAATAEEIVMADGFPSTQEPLLPIHRFGNPPPGFHAMAALGSLWSGAPTWRATIYILCLAAAALSFLLYGFLRAAGFSPPAAAAAGAGAVFLARNPQFFLQWGGAPSVLAAAIGLLVLRDLLGFGEEASAGRALRAGILAAGLVTVHPLPAVGLTAIGMALLVLRARASGAVARRVVRDAAVAAAVAVVLGLPFLLLAARAPVAGTQAWARGWFLAETRGAALLAGRFAPWLGAHPRAALWPFFLVSYLGALPTLLLAAGLVLSLLGPRRNAGLLAALILAVDALLFWAALSEAVPGWPSLYPTRTGLWLMAPLAIALAEFVARFAAPARLRPLRTGLALAILAAAFTLEGWRLSPVRFGTAFYGQARDGRASIASLLANEAAGGAFWITTFCSDVAAVTQDDVAALAWAAAQTPRDAVFANNPGDGGALLPAAAHRKILEPHYYWFFDRDEFETWRAQARPSYVFVGARPAPAWQRRWTAEALDREPGFQLVARVGQARIYRVARVAAPAASAR